MGRQPLRFPVERGRSSARNARVCGELALEASVAGAADRTTEDRFFATQTPLRRTSLDRSIQGEQNSMTRSSQGRDVTGCCASLTNVKQASATCKRETSLRGLD